MIDGFTCCVGEMYADQLKRSLPVWLDTLDSLTVVTRPNDPITKQKANNLKFVLTDVFTAYGAHFNKGAALCEAYAEANPSDWALHFDSDIIPPKDWREVAERHAKKGKLSGVYRYSEEGNRLDESPLYPYGYFHLWHSNDPRCHRWPLFDTWHGHAGSYDANFTDMWPKVLRADLKFTVIHQGERRTNWFGPGADKQLMKEIAKEGYRNHRMKSNRGVGRLPIPPFAIQYAFRVAPLSWTRALLEVCRSFGPFAVEAKIITGSVPKGCKVITPAKSPEVIRQEIERAING